MARAEYARSSFNDEMAATIGAQKPNAGSCRGGGVFVRVADHQRMGEVQIPLPLRLKEQTRFRFPAIAGAILMSAKKHVVDQRAALSQIANHLAVDFIHRF